LSNAIKFTRDSDPPSSRSVARKSRRRQRRPSTS
jgi:hypothetical protein